eukprot:COSAG02_NODE_6153_length_3763_cov_743.881550_1_plen_78_part_00
MHHATCRVAALKRGWRGRQGPGRGANRPTLGFRRVAQVARLHLSATTRWVLVARPPRPMPAGSDIGHKGFLLCPHAL